MTDPIMRQKGPCRDTEADHSPVRCQLCEEGWEPEDEQKLLRCPRHPQRTLVVHRCCYDWVMSKAGFSDRIL
jgi:hypothetical protein